MPDTHETPGTEGILAKFRHASDGFFTALRTERNLRIHCVVAVLALIACFLLKVPPFGWIAVIVMIVLVISAELFNTALENLCDKVCPEQDPFIKRAKDASAAAVLVCALGAVVVGLAIYIPVLIQMLG